ncbi:hypothetical protein [Pseudovibrio sp. Alg231-02]|uniref:hypothetical protein n=1 Tax=Pseudovibrio sp. Alg231-02 TaxID=1922223 RepID=UPI000D55D85C|nr:hypothetical protein [Pseudovibrio sp. Alg231-02]
MEQLSSTTLQYFLERFGHLNGAILQSALFTSGVSGGPGSILLEFAAHDCQRPATSPQGAISTLKIRVEESLEFKLHEPGGGAYTTIKHPIVGMFLQDKFFLNFDSVNSKDWTIEEWDKDQMRNSVFYVGGARISWEIED